MNIQQISSLTDPRIRDFLTTKDRQARAKDQIIVDSPKVVLRMIAAGLVPRAILASLTFIEQHADTLSKSRIDLIYRANKDLLEAIVGHNLHHGVIALADRPGNLTLSELGTRILVLNGVNQAENVGTIIRSCDALAVDSIIVDHKSVSPFVRRAIRVSMGSVFRVKIRHSNNLALDLKALADNSTQMVGTSIDLSAQSLRTFEFSSRAALIIGSEGQGIDQEILNLCDSKVKIPIRAGVDSLNAAAAASICLYCLSPL